MHRTVKHFSPFDKGLLNEQFPPLRDAAATYSIESSLKLSDNVRTDGQGGPLDECSPCLRKRDNVLAADRYLRPPNRSAGRGLTNMTKDNEIRFATPGRLVYPFSVSDIDTSYLRGYDSMMRNFHYSKFIVQDWPQGGYPTRLKDKYFSSMSARGNTLPPTTLQ